MKTLARLVALVLALVAATLVAVLVVREIVLAGGEGEHWPIPQWWRWLVDTSVKERATVGGLIAVLLGVVFLALAALALRRPVRRSGLIALSNDEERGELTNTLSVKASALEHLVGGGLSRRLPEVRAVSSVVRRQPDGFAVSAAAEVSAVDVAGVQRRAAACVAADLAAATGIGLVRLDLEVRRFIVATGERT